MSRLRFVLVSICIILMAASIYRLATSLDYQRYSDDVVEELMYFPSGRALKIASLGFDTMTADLMWLRGIQYYGQHRKTDKYYPLAAHVFSTITDLDPGFIGAYRFGAFVLAEDVGQPHLATALLKKGIQANPHAWELAFDLGFIYLLELGDNLKAAQYFNLASRRTRAPEMAKRFAAFAYSRAGRAEVAKQLWEEMYHTSPNRVVRESAEFALANLDIDQWLSRLSELAGEFNTSRGRRPRTLDEMVEAGLLASVPEEALGGRFFVDSATGQILSTSRVASRAQETERYLERQAARFYMRHGRYPRMVSELKEEGLVDEIPILVGAEMVYNPTDGSVSYLFAWDEPR